MEASVPNAVAGVLSLAFLYLAPILAVSISAVYFYTSPHTEPLFRRIVASAHGATIALLYIASMCVYWFDLGRVDYGSKFAILLLIPAVLIVVSFFLFRGRKSIHGLQMINFLCLIWTGYVGPMAVAGIWT